MRKLKTFELNRLTIQEFKEIKKLPLVVVLDDIRSMYNVGAFFRTSDAFLIKQIHICGITPIPPHREIHKTAIGATESVEWKYFKNVKSSILSLKEEGYFIAAIEQTDKSIMLDDFTIDDSKKYALVFGNEVMGISDILLDNLDVSLEIPQFGTKHSLNVSVAGGIIMHHFAKGLLERH